MTKPLLWLLLMMGCAGSRAPTTVIQTKAAAPIEESAALTPEAGVVSVAPASVTDSGTAIDEASAPVATRPSPSIVITLRRTMCLGTCPSYRATLRGDGTVVYEGDGFVRVHGRVVTHRDPAAIAKLASTLEHMGYFSLEIPTYCDQFATDHPSAATSVSYRGRTRAIDHYYGNFCIPELLTKIEDEIDRVAGTKALVECPSGACSR